MAASFVEAAGGNARLRVYLVDDHPIVLLSVRTLVDAHADMVVVGTARDGLTAVEEASAAKPDVVVMDVLLPGLGGAEATARIIAASPRTKVLVLTARDEPAYAQLLMKAGAAGYLLKRVSGPDLVHAIRAVANGGMFLDPSVARSLVSPKQPARRKTVLSARETEVTRQIAEGHAMKEIADSLAVSTRTLETYRSRAMEKLGIHTRAEMVDYALRTGLLKMQ